MGTIAQEVKRSEARGDKSVAGFAGAVRSVELNNLEKGDVLIIPETFNVRETSIRGTNGTTNTAQYIFCELEGRDGEVKQLFPGTFTKMRVVYNEDGTPVRPSQRVYTKGTAATLFRQHSTVAEAMDALKGKKVRVTDIIEVRTLRYGSKNDIVTAEIPVLDLVEEEEEQLTDVQDVKKK